MLEGLIAIFTVATVASGQIQPVSTAISTLPSRPPRSQLSCHDLAWESANLSNVSGSRLNKALAPFIERALVDGTAQNINLSITSAYRNCDQQTNLRLNACGPGEYNLLQKPAELCLPPTEIAGQSLHGEGLAIDFGCSGYPLFENSPCYAWMKQNAIRYHFYEHPLEPWHWSTTGY